MTYGYRGRHRAPSTSGRTAAGLAVGATVALPLVATPAVAADGGVWDRVADCESSGNWSINTGNGFYGGLQFTLSTWRAFGGTGLPQNASRATQIAVAQRVLAGQGPGAWPVCSVKAGLTRTNGGATSAPVRSARAAAPAPARAATPVTPRAATTRVHAPAPTARAVPHRPASVGAAYTVKPGDTLSKIAARNGVSGGWRAIFDRSRDVVETPDLIFPGERVHLP